ncbi:DeoR/GlpR family DNA-binding transcription regulator [Mesorhizobium sp. BAC0120]|uniref:DeoR/GlpR family DNA-binding transcription regulator n=1 Tax=Mesorhizobium sp. BAC0120 TaxID=3090670 RepID=UPI00298BF42B|nr:DeoR/GlpR family DNA-binding transcription regulator [Mesorhizobium sp. BAC0120]MDW6022902.1 DeoR/GlpR family DNA-binding transcription regulator [Mesorhizobium sp. BAC0120]
MSADTRRQEIADYVIERGEARIDELVAAFGVSRMTIHRHVEELARQGIMRKLHGAVSAQPSGVYESLFRFRATRAAAAKSVLARAALAEIEPGQAIVLDDSTTANALAPLLPGIRPLTVVTNSLALAQQLTEAEELKLILLGGEYHPTYNAFIGHICESALERIRVNLLICSASAVNGTAALIQDPQVVRVKKAMHAAAARRILLIDSSKFGKVALHLFADLTEFDLVLADSALPEQSARALIAAGVNLKIVPSE